MVSDYAKPSPWKNEISFGITEPFYNSLYETNYFKGEHIRTTHYDILSEDI